MRGRFIPVALAVLGVSAFVAVPRAAAQDKLPFKVEGELKPDDPKDKKLGGSPSRTYDFKMQAGKTYTIDLKSKVFDAFLRLEDSDGKEVAFDDDSGGGLDSRIVYKAPKDGTYKIVATSLDGKAGQYTLEANEGGKGAELEASIKGLRSASAEDRKKILDELVKHFGDPKNKISVTEARLFFEVANSMEGEGGDAAAEVYTAFGKLLAGAPDPNIAQFGRQFEGAGRRVGLVGKEMEVLRGTLVDGKPLDWKSYRGKVVLVDFWATWCGPCVKEMPNVRELYTKYKDKGFEVIGVSVDQKREDLDKFLKEQQLPWVQVHDKTGEGGTPSMSDYYGVMAIPLPILVGRDGRVLSMNARGPELERLLERHLINEEKK